MLYPEIQNGEEVIKVSDFQQDIGGIADFMKMIIKATKGCGKLSSNNTFFSDFWFRAVKISEE